MKDLTTSSCVVPGSNAPETFNTDLPEYKHLVTLGGRVGQTATADLRGVYYSSNKSEFDNYRVKSIPMFGLKTENENSSFYLCFIETVTQTSVSLLVADPDTGEWKTRTMSVPRMRITDTVVGKLSGGGAPI